MVKETLFNFIEKNTALILELETELTKRPAVSPESGGEGEGEKGKFLEEWLKSRGITQLERYDAPDERAAGGVRPNLIATIPGKTDAKRLWIMSHLDVVPPGEASLWQSDPWQVIQREGPQGPILVGRGVEDNQQGLCSSVLAALALAAQGITPPHTVKLLFVADEENGSVYGIDWLLKNQGKTIPAIFRKDDMILIPDGGDSRGETIEIAEKNILWVRFVTTGAQAHGSRPDEGNNAHLAGADLAVRLHYGLSEQFPDRAPSLIPIVPPSSPPKRRPTSPMSTPSPGRTFFIWTCGSSPGILSRRSLRR